MTLRDDYLEALAKIGDLRAECYALRQRLSSVLYQLPHGLKRKTMSQKLQVEVDRAREMLPPEVLAMIDRVPLR